MFRGTTLHSFAGVFDTSSAEQMIKKILNSRVSSRKWRDAKVLVIDEVSMLSEDLFDKLYAVAQGVRKDNSPFGGIQLVLTGDFFQVRPLFIGYLF